MPKKYHVFIYLLQHDLNLTSSLDIKILVMYILTRLFENPTRRKEAIDNYDKQIFQAVFDVVIHCRFMLNPSCSTNHLRAEAPNSITNNFINIKDPSNIQQSVYSSLFLWSLLCLGKLCENNPTIQQRVLRNNVVVWLKDYLYDNDPRIRATVVSFFGNLFKLQPHGAKTNGQEKTNEQLLILLILDIIDIECSTMVKKEIMIVMFKFISKYHEPVKLVAFDILTEMNYETIQLLFNPKLTFLQRLPIRKIKKMKRKFHSTLLDVIYTEMELPPNPYLGVFKCAMKLLIDATPEIVETTKLFMATIFPFELNLSNNVTDTIQSLMNFYNRHDSIGNYTHNYRRKLFDKLPDSDAILSSSNLNKISSPQSINNCTHTELETNWDDVFGDAHSSPLPSCIHWDSQILISDLIFRCATFFMQPIMHDDIISYKRRKELFECRKQQESNWETFKGCSASAPIEKDNFSIRSYVTLVPQVSYPAPLKFHPYQPQLYLSQQNIVYAVNWSKDGAVSTKIINHANKAIDIATIELINEDHASQMLLTGTDDGVVKIWSLNNTYEETNCLSGQISSWKALPSLINAHDSIPTMTTAWNQRISTLCVGGWSDHVYCWDLNVERLSGSISIEDSPSPTLSMAFFDKNCDSLVCSNLSGNVNIYDLRTFTGTVHQCEWIVGSERISNSNVSSIAKSCKVFPSKANDFHIHIASASGNFYLYDIRQQKVINHHEISICDINSCDYQPYHGRFAYQSADRNISIVDDDGKLLYCGRFKKPSSKDKSPSNYLAIKFHPFMSVLALYKDDGVIDVVHTFELQDTLLPEEVSRVERNDKIL